MTRTLIAFITLLISFNLSAAFRCDSTLSREALAEAYKENLKEAYIKKKIDEGNQKIKNNKQKYRTLLKEATAIEGQLLKVLTHLMEKSLNRHLDKMAEKRMDPKDVDAMIEHAKANERDPQREVAKMLKTRRKEVIAEIKKMSPEQRSELAEKIYDDFIKEVSQIQTRRRTN